jgi:hypothetical protein
MKILVKPFIVVVFFLTAFTPVQSDNVEFSCLKTIKATNTCHFNFKVDGAKYRYVDIGCKYSKKQQDVIKKAKDGTLALAKDWKIECPEPKEKKEGSGF